MQKNCIITNNLDNSTCLTYTKPDFIQLDGNISLGLLSTDEDSWTESNDPCTEKHHIEVITGNRPEGRKTEPRQPVLRRIRRKNCGELALYLPTVAVYNHRSIWKKIRNFSTEFRELKMGIALHSEVWEKKEKKAHMRKIDELFHMDGISYISTPHPGRRGGGSAITCDDENYFIKEIKVENPSNLELTFAILRPKSESSPTFSIILCALYSPPRSRKKSKLIDHITQTYHWLKLKYPSAFFLMGGDINCLDVSQLLSISGAFKQIVNRPTRQSKILSIIITDLHSYYQEPFIIQPLQPDVPGCGKPSDHSVPVAIPYTDTSRPRKTDFELKVVRPIPESKLISLGQWITNEKFHEVRQPTHPTEKVEALRKIMDDKVEEVCPQKTVKIYKKDQEWMTEPLRRIRRMKSREYQRHGKSEKFEKLQTQFEELKATNTKKYMEEDIESLKNCNLSQFYRKIKVIGSRIDESPSQTFSIPEFIEENISPTDAAERIASHFSSISKEYPPLNVHTLPERVRAKILAPDVMKKAPKIEQFEVYEKFLKRKNKNNCVPGDIPSKLKKEFGPELAFPATEIFNSINETGEYPAQWKIEYVTPIPKTSPPETLDDLRNISLTADLSRDYDQLLVEWLLPFIKPRLDPGQFGGLKGGSIVQYLVLFFHFILSNVDKTNKSIIAAMIDFSKGFNRLNHNKIITRLSDWGVPGWLLKILTSYLSNRSMILRYRNEQSSEHCLPGGGPQGVTPGLLMFLVEVNDAGMDPPPPLPEPVEEGDVACVPAPPPAALTDDELRIKFVDDLSMAEVVDLQELKQAEEIIGPRNFHDRNALELPPDKSKLQGRLRDLETYVRNHDMKLNTKKTKLIPFNFSRKYDFEPNLILDGNRLDIVYKTKLLGVVCTSDCKWKENTKNLVAKANGKMWFLRRLKTLGASEVTLIDIYKLFIRSHLEFCAPLWSGAISSKNCQDLERIQKTACKIILGQQFCSYEVALERLEFESLEDRRNHLSLKFAKNCAENPNLSHLFPKGITTRTRTTYLEPEYRTGRFGNSAIPFMIRLLNQS